VPRRRKTPVPLHLRAASAGGALLFGVWDRAAQRPMDFAALVTAAALSTIVVVNAVFLQTGSRSAPYFAPPAAASSNAGAGPSTGTTIAAAKGDRSTEKPVEQTVTPRLIAPGVVTPQPQPVAARRDDPIADLIAPSPRVAAVQRALSEYGYGQIKPTGVLDENTSATIQKFEREHKMPVTGRVSERLVSELTALVGHPLN
jgi:putative peptidoglycan binding protein